MHHVDEKEIEENFKYLERWASKRLFLFAKRRDFFAIARLSMVIEYIRIEYVLMDQVAAVATVAGRWKDDQLSEMHYLLSSIRDTANNCKEEGLDDALVKLLGYLWEYLEINNFCKLINSREMGTVSLEEPLVPESWPCVGPLM